MTTPNVERHDARKLHHGSLLHRLARARDVGGALLALVAAGGLWWGARPAAVSSGMPNAAAAKVEGLTKSARHSSIDTAQPVLETKAAVARAAELFAVPEAPRALPAGLTYPGSWLATMKPGETNVVKFGSPRQVAATAEPGAIVVGWAMPDATVVISGFEVRRIDGADRAGPDERFKVVGRTAGDALTFRDEQVQAGESYRYVVVALTSDSILTASGRATSPESDGVTVRATSDSAVELVDASEGAVHLRIKKKSGASWRTRTVTVKEGEMVGGVDPSTGLDWATGRKVSKISEAISESEKPREEVVFDRLGRVVLEGGVPKRVSVVRRDAWRTISVTLTGGGAPDETLILEKR